MPKSELCGVVLAGGRGNRLMPLTRVAGKHFLPVYDRPMVFHALEALAVAGVRRAVVVTDPPGESLLRDLVTNPAEHGLGSIDVAVQHEPTGIAAGLALAESFAAGQDMMVLLGDNLFGRSLAPAADEFRRAAAEEGAQGLVTVCRVHDPRHYGVARFDGSNAKIIEIIEKPQSPPTDLAVTGAYFYRASVFPLIAAMTPDDSGILEITALNNTLIARGTLEWADLEGWWADAGTFDGLLAASNHVARHGVNGKPPRAV